MLKVFVASFSRSSEGALSKLKKEMGEMLTTSIEEADYIVAVGDRKETFDFTLLMWEQGKKIIHLWAGEGITNTKDDLYRNAITLMSTMQLCTNEEAAKQTAMLMHSAGLMSNVAVVGNVMLDNLEIDESLVPRQEYLLYLENPGNPIIVVGNGMDLIEYSSLPRKQFLGLLKNCQKFYTNSSCEYYEAPIFLKPEQIIHIGSRNSERGSKYANMKIENATQNIIKAIQGLEKAKN
jgi:UDP-N-acetylglucosamine 2-epimerase